MRVWSLTVVGKRLARSTRNPDSPVYRVLHCLDFLGSATSDRIAEFTGLSNTEVGLSLSKMMAFQPPLVQNV
jgi:hypothetical protein